MLKAFHRLLAYIELFISMNILVLWLQQEFRVPGSSTFAVSNASS
jgi:hypothetical protein